MGYKLEGLENSYKDLGPMTVDYFLAPPEKAKEVLGSGYRASVYLTVSYKPQPQYDLFPHIIIDNEGKAGGGRTHLTPKAGTGIAHTNGHIWHYEGGDAFFVDPMCVSACPKQEIMDHCQVLAAFVQSAFGVSVTKFLCKRHTDDKYMNVSAL